MIPWRITSKVIGSTALRSRADRIAVVLIFESYSAFAEKSYSPGYFKRRRKAPPRDALTLIKGLRYRPHKTSRSWRAQRPVNRKGAPMKRLALSFMAFVVLHPFTTAAHAAQSQWSPALA